MKVNAPRRISRPKVRPSPEDMLEGKKCNLAGSRLDACPTVGANCHGNEPDSRSRGYVRRGQGPSYGEIVHTIYEFRPLAVEVTTLRLGAQELSCRVVYMCYRGCEPLCQRGGAAYIECATPHECLATKGPIVGIKRTLLIT